MEVWIMVVETKSHMMAPTLEPQVDFPDAGVLMRMVTADRKDG